MYRRIPASCTLAALLWLSMAGPQVPFAQAQYLEENEPVLPPNPDEAEPDQPKLELPAKVPAVKPFDAMTRFVTDGSTPNEFALDADSINLQPHYALATIAVRSPSGALTIGYYGFACQFMQYRLLAYPDAKGQWQPSSRHARWHDVHDSESRNRQFRTVYDAGCRVGGRAAANTASVMRVLSEGQRSRMY